MEETGHPPRVPRLRAADPPRTVAHAAAYVDGVLDLTLPNGFGNFDARVAKSLPWTNGSFVAAAEHARRTGGVAIAPVSGFHHAEFADGGGFCTFNGLAIAAARLVKQGVRKLGILDCDAHFGNGTEDILDRAPGLLRQVIHYTRGSLHYRGGASEAPAFLAHLPVLLDEWKAEGVETVEPEAQGATMSSICAPPAGTGEGQSRRASLQRSGTSRRGLRSRPHGCPGRQVGGRHPSRSTTAAGVEDSVTPLARTTKTARAHRSERRSGSRRSSSTPST